MPLKSHGIACLGMRPSRLRGNFEHPRSFEWPHTWFHPQAGAIKRRWTRNMRSAWRL